MTWQDWAPHVKDVVMGGVVFLAWMIGRERKMLNHTVDDSVDKRISAVTATMVTQKDLDVMEAKLMLAIERGEHRAKHEAINEVAARLLQVSEELDTRFADLGQRLNAIVIRRPKS